MILNFFGGGRGITTCFLLLYFCYCSSSVSRELNIDALAHTYFFFLCLYILSIPCRVASLVKFLRVLPLFYRKISFSALRRHAFHGTLPSIAEETADFVEKANDLFDMFNCFGHAGDRKRPIRADDLSRTLAVSLC